MSNADTLQWLAGLVDAGLTPEAKQRIEELARQEGVTMARSCPNRWRDAAIIILSKYRKMARKKQQKYTLQRGVAFTYNGVIYTAANITDEAAEWWLDQNPANARYLLINAEWEQTKTMTAPVEGTSIKGDE